jgi:type IV pilus assembly protein PilW
MIQHRPQSVNRLQRGVTMIEILITLVIGLVIVLGVGSTFDTNRRTYRFQEAVAQTQEQGRFAMDFLAGHVRMAGFPGNNPPAGNKVEGSDAGTDTLRVRYDADLNCQDNSTGGVADNRFRINNNNLECSGDGGATWDLFVQNVEDMQIVYGEDTDADGIANRYITASDGPTWPDVVAVRISLIVRSQDFSTDNPRSFVDLAGITVTPTDERLRQRFVSTINLRN